MTGSLTLILETSTPRASLALVNAGGDVVQREFTGDRNHNAVLFRPLKELLDGSRPEPLVRVLVGSGPGSYSGTRVGIAAAQGVAIAHGCPAVAVPSILAVPAAAGGAACIAIGDARRGSFWVARIAGSDTAAEPMLMDAAELVVAVEEAARSGLPVICFEDPTRLPLPAELAGVVDHQFPDAERLWRAWLAAPDAARDRWQAAAPQPIYLKPPHITPAKRPWLVQPHG